MSTSAIKTIASLEKAFHILEAVSAASHELKIVELVNLTGYSRSSVQRLAHTLCSIGLLSRTPGITTFSLGTRVTKYAYSFLRAHSLIEVSMPFLVDMTTQMDLGCDLWLVDNSDLVATIRLPSLAGSEPMAATGMRLSTLKTAAGVAVYSTLSPKEQENWTSIYRTGLDSVIKARSNVEAGISDILRNGFYFESGESNRGLSTWAAPIYDYSNKAVAAISVTKRVDTTDHVVVEKIGRQLAQCAQAISDMRIQSSLDRRPAQINHGNTKNTENEVADDPLFIHAVARGFKLLDCLQPSLPALTLTEFHKLTGFSIAMTQRFTNTLVSAGYLVRDSYQKTFRLSARTLDLLYGFQSKFQLLKVVWPKMIQLRKETGLRCSFCVLADKEIVHLLNIQSASHADYKTGFAGRHLPALSTSGGLAILSKKSSDFLDQFLQTTPITQLTPFTITDKKELRNILLRATEDGFAFTDQQSTHNELNVAVPVQRNGNESVGAIVISAPITDWNYESLVSNIVPLIKQVA